jgi:hypothetical protein
MARPQRRQDDSKSRLDRFHSFTVAHPRLLEAKDALMNAIRQESVRRPCD